MTIEAVETIESVGVEEEDELDHIICCKDENIALCGIDLTNVAWTEWNGPKPEDCIVCEHMFQTLEAKQWKNCRCPRGNGVCP